MTDSIFDPTGPQTEHSGTRNLGPDARDAAQMPPDAIDGKVQPDPDRADEDSDTRQIAEAEAQRDREGEQSNKTQPE